MNPKAGTIVVDVDGTETAGEFPPIPEGTYACKVIDAKLEETRAGWPMPTFTLEVQDGEYKGRRVWHRRPVMPPDGEKKGTIAFVKADAEAFGVTLTKSSVLDLARMLTKEGFGKQVAAKVGFGTGDYADKNEVKRLLPISTLDGYQSEGPVLLDE